MSTMNFELYEDSAGEYRWRLRRENGTIVGDSGQGYASRRGARNSIDGIKEYAPDAAVPVIGSTAFEVYEDEAGEHRWRLRHQNGKIVAASSVGYDSRSDAEDAIDAVKREAPAAESQRRAE